MNNAQFDSKNIFFLYPHSVMKQGMIQDIVANEYAAYIVDDHKKIKALIKSYDNPIMFINIDEVLDESGWLEYVRELISDEANTVRIGILSYNDNPDLARIYLMDMMVPCGFIKLKLGLEQSKKIILKTLEVNEAKGRRKYLRVNGERQGNTGFNVKIRESLHSGYIKDISSVGMAFSFEQPLDIPNNIVLSDMQLKLQGKLARVSGPVIGKRETEDGLMHVMLFDKNTDPDTRARIHLFIYESLQSDISNRLARL